MSLPSDLTTIVLTGTYQSITGQALSGQVNFSVTTPVQDSTGKVILGIGTQSVTLNSSGYFSITLPCTDNADLNPTGFTYLVTEVIPGLGRAYNISLPHTLGSTVDLSSLAPVSVPPAATAFASANTWTATQTYSGNPGLKITTGAANGDVLSSDGSGNATWQSVPFPAGLAPTGLTGATAASRYAGGTTSGAPVSGTFAVGDYVIDQTGKMWICTTAGTPGTWTQAGTSLPLTTLGDLLYENATPALARLAGNTTSTKNFLTQTGTGSVSAAPAWGTLAAGDLPAATTSTQGAVILDGTASDIQPLGIAAAGSKGQAADAKHVHPYQSYQFLPESYGAKGDGAFLYDVAISSASATLTTVGLPAPSAPTLNAGSGSVGAGTYQVKVTYVNQYGETTASTATPITVGASSSIIVTTPGSWTNATGYYVYCTQAGGSTYTRQQGSGSPTSVGVNYTLSANPTNTGAAPPGANTSASSPFTSSDVGKLIVVPDAGGGSNIPLCTTIKTFNNAQSVVLNASASSSVTSYGAVYGTDDTTAWQNCINAAVTHGQATEQGLGEILAGNRMYCIGGAVQTTIGGNNYWYTQLAIPYVLPFVGNKVQLKITGPVEASGPVHWDQPNPQANGAVLVCMRGDGAYNGDQQCSSVLGGPTNGFGGSGGAYSNIRVVIDGLNMLVPYRSTYAGLDLYGCAQMSIQSYGYFAMARTTVGSAGGWPLYQIGLSNPATWRTFGLRPPAPGNNDQSDVDRLTVYGAWMGSFFGDHFIGGSIKVVFCAGALIPFASPLSSVHHSYVASLSSEATAYPLYAPDSGQFVLSGSNGGAVVIGVMHLENAVALALDNNNTLYGIVLGAEQLGSLQMSATGGANIKIIQTEQPPGKVASPPVVPGSTVAYTNIYGKDAVVVVTGGTVSSIAIDTVTTGLTSGPVTVRNGGTITLTYTAAPTWNWVLNA